jgi:hypothetical protein
MHTGTMSGPLVHLVHAEDPTAGARAVVMLLRKPDYVAKGVAKQIELLAGGLTKTTKMSTLAAIMVHVPPSMEYNHGDVPVPPVIHKKGSRWDISDVWKPYMLAPKNVGVLNGALVLRLDALPAVDPNEANVTVVEREPGYPTGFQLQYNNETFILPVVPAVRYAVWYRRRSDFTLRHAAKMGIQSLAIDVAKGSPSPIVEAFVEHYSRYAEQNGIPDPENIASLCATALADYMTLFALSSSKAFDTFLADNRGDLTLPNHFTRPRQRARKSNVVTSGAFADMCV